MSFVYFAGSGVRSSVCLLWFQFKLSGRFVSLWPEVSFQIIDVCRIWKNMHSVTFYLPEEDFCYHTCFVFPQINTHVLQHRQSAFFKLIFMKGLIVFGASITLHMNSAKWLAKNATKTYKYGQIDSCSVGKVFKPEPQRFDQFPVWICTAHSWRPPLFTVARAPLQRQLIRSHRQGDAVEEGKTPLAPLDHHGRWNTFEAPNGETRSPEQDRGPLGCRHRGGVDPERRRSYHGQRGQVSSPDELAVAKGLKARSIYWLFPS